MSQNHTPGSSLNKNEVSTYSTNKRLFHIERSKNLNIVCYDIKLNSSGEWDVSDPIKVYWVNREENPGKTNGLSAIQKKLAYGYKLLSHDKNSCTISLHACPDKHITIKINEKTYCCQISINGQEAELKKVYVKSSDNNSLKVEYVELFGIDLKTGNPISEKIIK